MVSTVQLLPQNGLTAVTSLSLMVLTKSVEHPTNSAKERIITPKETVITLLERDGQSVRT